MAELFGCTFTKRSLMEKIGDISQIAGAKQYEFSSGKAKGVHAIDVKTGSGFNFTVLPDRCMDIAWADYKGFPIAFISKTGVVSPAFFNDSGFEFFRNFYAGLLTTCGLTYMGSPCRDNGEELGLHGRISNTPAENVAVISEWIDDDYFIKIKGEIRQSTVFGENILLKRNIITKMGDKKLRIKDTIENCGFNKQPFMLLYHSNYGYPIVSSETKLILPDGNVRARDTEAEKGIAEYNVFQEPTHDYKEQVFYHDLQANNKDISYACLFNKNIGDNGLGAYIKFNKKELPHLIEWKQMGQGDYVVGLEPATWYPEGRAKARERNELQYIAPGEIKEFNLEIGAIESKEELETIY